MPKLTLNGVTIEVAQEILLSQAIGLHQPMELPCAEQGRCGKCRVKASGALSPMNVQELHHLSTQEQAAGIRLACQCHVQGDCVVQQVLQNKSESRVRIEGSMPTFAEAPLFAKYGVALDIGTTTLAAQLYAADGTLCAQVSAQNPQVAFGADVISRIEGSLTGKAEELATCIREGVSGLVQSLCAQAGILVDAVEQMIITGNTAMLYLFTARNPECLSHAPFEADCLFGFTQAAADFQLPCAQAQVYFPPCMSAFVGADITTALLASEICDQSETALLADIGTNGEMALWHKGSLYCCSTAAGPAFEGAGLSMGMAGKDGAIDTVRVGEDGYDVHVIGDVKASGICGSGIIDALACFLQTEDMDETGFLEDDEITLGGTVTVTQADVRMVQLAKSAICAGMQTLVEGTDALTAQDVASLSIAGGFGSYIDLDHAADIGLMPREYLGKTKVIGNAALAGAVMLLRNHTFYEKAQRIASGAITIDLSSNPRFSDAYMMGMMFGDDL